MQEIASIFACLPQTFLFPGVVAASFLVAGGKKTCSLRGPKQVCLALGHLQEVGFAAQVSPLLCGAMLVPRSRPFLVHRSHRGTCCPHTAAQAEPCRMPPYTPALWETQSFSISISVSPFRSLAQNIFSILCGPGRGVRGATASWQSLTSPSLSDCCCQSLLYSSSMVALLCFCIIQLFLSLNYPFPYFHIFLG